jgi:hypothetical protein
MVIMVGKVERGAILTLTAVLVSTAIAILIWMACIRWTDSTGISAGVIFLVLAAIQLGLSIMWLRRFADVQHSFMLQDSKDAMVDDDIRPALKKRLADSSCETENVC